MHKLKIYFTTVKGRRETNEDRHTIILNSNSNNTNLNPINLFGIYDGHGGTAISNYLEKNISNYYLKKDFKPPFKEKYHCKVFEIIQSQLKESSLGFSNGSTCLLNIMYKFNDSIYMNVVNLGDSRLVIVNNDGTSNQITTDHKPDDPDEKKRIENIGGQIYKDSEGVIRIGDLSLSRAFGDADNEPYISQVPDCFYIKLSKQNKYIVMACDGLWDVIDTNNLSKIINDILKKNSKNLASELAQYALENNSTDNVSVIVIEIN